jgi:hypothetical protein
MSISSTTTGSRSSTTMLNRDTMGRAFLLGWSRFLDTATGSRLAETLARIDCCGT